MLASTHVVAVGLCVCVVALAVVVRHALVQHVLSILQGLTILTSMYTPFSKYSETAPTSSPCGKHLQFLIVSFDYYDVKKRSKLQDLIHKRLGHKYFRLLVAQPASGDCQDKHCTVG